MHKMRMLVVTFAETVRVMSWQSVPSCFSETHTHKPGRCFLSPSGAQQQKVVGGMEMSCG